MTEDGENFIIRSFITCTLRINIIRRIKLRRIRWAGHVARMGGRETHVGYKWENHKERDL
jgi:hypothetical protein